jgi:hypothetical protein
MQERWREREYQLARAASFRCLLGTKLASGVTPTGHIRRILLGPHPKNYPSRCTVHLERAERAMFESGRSLHLPTTESEVEAAASGSMLECAALNTFLDGAPGASAEDIPLPPVPAAVLDIRSPSLMTGDGFRALSVDPIPARELSLVGVQICRLHDGLKRADCVRPRYPRTWNSRSLQGATDGATPLLRLGQTVVRGDTGKEVCGTDCTAFSGPDQNVTTVARNRARDQFELSMAKLGQEPAERYEINVYDPFLVEHGRAFWEQDQSLMMVSMEHPEPRPIASDVGSIMMSGLSACRLDSGLVLSLRRDDAHELVFLADGRQPSRGQVTVSTAEESFETDEGKRRFGCGDDEVWITEVRSAQRGGRYRIAWGICTTSKCRSGEVNLSKLLANRPEPYRPDNIRDDVRAVGLDGKLLIVWRSDSAGFRFFLEDPDKLQAAVEHLAYDDRMSAEGNAFPSTTVHHDFRLEARRDAAVLLLHTVSPDRTQAVRIDADGSVAIVGNR